jgi:hypothetical protein
VSLALCATSDGIRDPETAAQAINRADPSPPNREETPLFSRKWSTRIGRRLARAEQTMRVRIARDELRRLRELTLAVRQLEREITALVTRIAPQLLDRSGFGPLIAAKLVG